MGKCFGSQRKLERRARGEHQVERTILVIHCDKSVEREQVGEEGAEP